MDWWHAAACADLPFKESERLFFSTRSGFDQLEGRRICHGCPVRRECLRDADRYEDGHMGGRNWTVGIRGGLTVTERIERRSKARS